MEIWSLEEKSLGRTRYEKILDINKMNMSIKSFEET
jgi:hypothetical protein